MSLGDNKKSIKNKIIVMIKCGVGDRCLFTMFFFFIFDHKTQNRAIDATNHGQWMTYICHKQISIR